MKHLYYGLPDLLYRVVQQEMARIPRSLASAISHAAWSIVYMPQVGFVMRMEGGRLPESLTDSLPDYQFAFEGAL
jgi:DNA mismatch repair protein MSH5